jgi:hypothetical protein
MLTRNRSFYFWCVIMSGLILITILPDNAALHDLVSGYDSNRWAHFISYATVITIPVALWRRKIGVLLSLVTVFVAMALEFLPIHVPGEMAHTQSIPADLFGIAAGILLGLNIRAMRRSAKAINGPGSSPAVRL